ncbi:MAG: MraY family glycosyltransferase [Chitinophagaceae bacterium]
MNAMEYVFFVGLVCILFLIEWGYFHLADRFRIKDKPNRRSSHKKSTIRGGGIIFSIAWILFFMFSQKTFIFMTIGLLIISIVSFADDIKSVDNKIRLVFHTVGFAMCFFEMELLTILPLWLQITLFIVCIGAINAINFMDGINGITGLNALSVILPLMIFDTSTGFREPMIYLLAALIVFLFFNFRKNARCFAGDVGSVSMGYILIFLILGLSFQVWLPRTGISEFGSSSLESFEPKYILMLAVFGVDSVWTILHRLFLGENIFQAHRRHLFQMLSNEMKWPHLVVSAIYGSLQFIINMWILKNRHIPVWQLLACLIILSVVYIVAKRWIIVLTRKQKARK